MSTTALFKTVLVCAYWLVSACQIALAAEVPEYLKSFDPAKGFKPAQSDLTEVFLQLAGSLEYYGSPEPYLRHTKAEHVRIQEQYRQRFRIEPKDYCPAYMTDAYVNRLTANWKILAPKLGLDALAKDIGNLMRDAINGTRGNGTMLVEIFNQHQAKVYAAMTGKESEPADFDVLKSELITRLYLDKTSIDDRNFKTAERDAVGFTIPIRGDVLALFKKIDASQKPADADRIKAAIVSVFIDVGRMAQSELEVSLAEHALDRQATAKK